MSKRPRLKLYNIEDDYLTYLRQYDQRVPQNKPNGYSRPFVGVLLEINNLKYLAPLSSQIHTTQTDFPIKKKHNESVEEQIATVRFAYMVPVTDKVLREIDYSLIMNSDENYFSLLVLEDNYINSHKKELKKKCEMTYNNKINGHFNFCCDFKKLEEQAINYSTDI
ncbi:type III toxin-antitoxin system ToxN/AbiQ family toxin [Rodentibacter caecimuris]|uniref:type III toxin-antitoxin system ToxN/AbiQ family toxin n=1 Tax=Rodentibacter caecimuris TaxID=1796644 RepID=UPI00211A62E8|nr:type III toxin-antitoxin system ToxN/AbiQ family toxin [Rodentibacter heylii]MCQ9124704.1 type III toxin-antitoxin system ToxN/AbiQ family toxin [Rodentibacter heylii]MCX2962306.1 type III toxin-antitoxin system ToxN/AbiQ family toxin [Rodentibacter heylii]